MLQRYKLRLGDGTVLGVDHQGLKTWALDGKAMVQAADSHQWYPLREFLAAEYVAARRAARLKARDAPPVGTPRPLPLVYPTPREDKAPPQAAPAPSELPPFVAESSEIQVLAEATPFIAEHPVVPVLAEEPEVQALAEDPAEAEVSITEPVVEEAFAENPADAPILAEELTPAVGGNAEPSWIPDDGPSALAPPLDDRDEADLSAAPFSASDAVEPLFVDAPLGVQVLADEATVPSRESDSQPSMLDEDFPSTSDASLPPATASAPEPLESPLASPRPSLQPLADDLATGRTGATKEPWRPDDVLPIIPLKPLDDEAPSAAGLGTYEGRPDEIDEALRRSELQETLIRWFVRGISAYDALLTGWFDRLARRPGSISPGGRAPHTADPVASIPLAPPVTVPPEVGTLAEEPMGARIENAPPRSIEDLLSQEPPKPPPPIRDLPVLRLVDIPEPAEEGDVYRRESRLYVAWRWTRRILVTGGLLAGGLFAALRWETWVPRAEVLGRGVFTEIERIKDSRERREQERQALQEATERLPHLAPQTIRLLMANSPTGILDPPEMFRLASDAADRGVGALTSGEVRELKELRGEVLKALRPS
ncbi:MAG: hypothetical protein ACRDV9_05015, partial [Acidimicrobiia bacterium]